MPDSKDESSVFTSAQDSQLLLTGVSAHRPLFGSIHLFGKLLYSRFYVQVDWICKHRPTYRYSYRRPECVDIAHRRLAKESFVLPIELTRALIPDFKGRTRGIEFLCEHLLTRCVKPKLFLKLQRAHGSEAAEVMVEGRSTHPGHRCKVIHVQCLLVVLTQPIDRLSCPIVLVSQCSDGTQTISLRSLKKPVDDLTLEQLAKEGNVLRSIENLNHAAARCKEFYRRLTEHHAARSGRRCGNRHLVGMKNVTDHSHIELEEEREVRPFFVPWGPMGMGYLTQKLDVQTAFDPKSDLRSTFDRFQPETIAANKPFVDRITELARTKGATTAQLSLAWLLAQKPFIVPIPGTGKVKHLQENIESTKLVLTADDLKELDRALAELKVYGGRMNEQQMSVVEQ